MSKKTKKGTSHSEILSKYSKLKIPILVLRKKPLTTYEALITFLKDEPALNYHSIAVLLDRDERDARKVYFRAKEKPIKKSKEISDKKILTKYSKIKIPILVLRKKPLTTYEALIVHLKDDSALNYHSIAVLLDRDERDARKVYFRAKDKLKNV